jgi:hemerythrin-like domain-containing protein
MPTATSRDRYTDMTREQLYDLAQERDIDGRSEMSRDELADALRLDDVGPDAIALLTSQHDAIRDLFARFGELSDRPSKKKEDLVAEIVTQLAKHAEVEEQVFYPAIAAEVDGVSDETDESLEEHHAAELLLAELDGRPSSSPRYDAKVHVLIEQVRHHIEEEETELFPLVRDQLSEQRRREIGAGLVEQWKVAPLRPHPHTPATPPANVLMSVPTAAWDATVGLVRWSTRQVRQIVSRRR